MTNFTLELHKLFNTRKRFSFPFAHSTSDIPENGIYIIFEQGEKLDAFDRIVRVGTHTGENQLRSRLSQHFLKENKNRSIFRKNIGRCILNKSDSPYLALWELDVTSREDRKRNLHLLDLSFEQEIEKKISHHIQSNLTFCVFQVQEKEDRLFWESRIVATLAKSRQLKPSIGWLGNQSPKDKIVKTGLWQVNELDGDILTDEEFKQLAKMIS